MKCSLWRDGVLLGRIRLPFDADDPLSFGGMFEPSPAFAEVGPLAQTHVTLVAGAPVVQLAGPPRAGRVRGSGRANGRIDLKALEQLTDGERRGVPADRLLEVRDEQGEVVAAAFIMVAELPPSFESVEGVQAQCAAQGIPYSAWYLGVRRASAPAPG